MILSNFETHGVATLEHLGVIRATGEDAVKFLHGQLTQDVVLLPVGQARLAALCNPKGRMLASFVVIKHGSEDVWLVCSRDLLASTLKRLSMFVLRAKVRLTDASADMRICGLLGNAQVNLGAENGPAPWSALSTDSAHAVQLYPAGTLGRQLWVAPADAPIPAGTPVSAQDWAWSEVASGVATVSASLVELFVPQMLNYESVGGVSFKKGCYPGQEVVARSQFRGTLKRRTYLAHASAQLQAAQELYTNGDFDQPAGLVVQVAALPDGAALALLCLQTNANMQALCTKEVPDIQITVQELPYALLEDI